MGDFADEEVKPPVPSISADCLGWGFGTRLRRTGTGNQLQRREPRSKGCHWWVCAHTSACERGCAWTCAHARLGVSVGVPWHEHVHTGMSGVCECARAFTPHVWGVHVHTLRGP